MTLSRNQLVFIVFVVMIAVAVGIAIWYVERVFREREREAELIREGRAEELLPPPPPPPPGPPPLSRPTTRGTEVLTLFEVTNGAVSRELVSIRGNGEFVRVPAAPDEPGPLVTGILDRARVDELIRAAEATAEGPDFALGGLGRSRLRLVAKAGPIAEIRSIAGKQMNRSAVPDRTFLKMTAIPDAAESPWPFARQKPESFAGGAPLTPETDRARFREGLLKVLQKGARFSHQGKSWQVTDAVMSLSP